MLKDKAYYGFSCEENTIHDRHDDVYHCAVVAALIFTAACGCVTGIISEFDLSVNYPVIILILLVSSLYLSFIHLSKFLYIAGYFLFLMIFTYGLLSFRSYANSGYQALLNIISKTYSDHYLLSSFREYTEIISDRYVTLTTVSIFIGVFLVLLLNVGIFNDKFFFTTFNLTFWPLQLGIFIGRYPSYFSLALLFFAYFGVYFVRHSGQFYFVQPTFGKKPREYVFDYDDANGCHMVHHKSNARTMFALCVFALTVSLIFSIFCSFAVTTSEEESMTNKSSFKASLDENVKIITQTGIAGMFNRYQAKGGISGGKLGGVRSVAPDYETDLKVTFVPYSFETLYLHAFTGQQYTGSRWNHPSASTGYKVNMPGSVGPASGSEAAADRILSESRTLQKLMDNGIIEKSSARMTVENLDADTSYIYVPYFLSHIPDKVLTGQYSTLSGFFATGTEETYEFIPYHSDLEPILLKEASGDENGFAEYEEEIYDNYLQIPDNIRDELMSYHDKIGTSDDQGTQIKLIYDYFLKNYTYDMAPGATPMGQDFVTYFMREQKRGYCAHFASAGVMLLRSYGIPARYAEGYVITTGGIAETGSNLDADASYYYTGSNKLGNSSVVTTEVTDGDAHAWAEVYINGFGWFPVEFTVPAVDDGRTSYGDFLSALSRLFAPSGGVEDEDTNNASDGSGDDTSTEHRAWRLKNSPVFIIFVSVLFILILIPLFVRSFRICSKYADQRRRYRAGDYPAPVAYRYGIAAKKLARSYKQPVIYTVNDNFALIEDLLSDPDKKNKRLKSFLKAAGISLNDIRLLTLTCLYSEKKISRSEADLLIRFFKSIR